MKVKINTRLMLVFHNSYQKLLVLCSANQVWSALQKQKADRKLNFE